MTTTSKRTGETFPSLENRKDMKIDVPKTPLYTIHAVLLDNENSRVNVAVEFNWKQVADDFDEKVNPNEERLKQILPSLHKYHVIVPSSVQSIGKYAFRGCTSLPSIELSSPFQSIGDWAFSDCTSLNKLTVSNSILNKHLVVIKDLLSSNPVAELEIVEEAHTEKKMCHMFGGCGCELTRAVCVRPHFSLRIMCDEGWVFIQR